MEQNVEKKLKNLLELQEIDSKIFEIKKGADVLISSDFKYHDFFEANNKITLIDIGHYESEQFTKDLIFEFLNKNLINIALHLSNENTNPIKYY